jgi:protein TonB
VNREKKINRTGTSRALIASVLLHCLVLLGLGAGTYHGVSKDQGELVVYLAMPAAVPERALVPQIISEKKTSAKLVQAQFEPLVQPKPRKVKPQLAATIMTQVEKPQPGPVPLQEIEVSEQSEIITEAVDKAFPEKPMRLVSEAQSEIESGEMESLTRNLKPETRNPAKAMLAFAGDPASLGMLARDALGPDLMEAKALTLPEPVYPVLSRKRGEEGRVIIEIEVSAEGKVLRAQVANSSSYPRLDRAAIKALQMATFKPATEYGKPVESITKVAYRFELKQ